MLDASARLSLADTRFADVRWLDEATSTNEVAADLARRGAAEGLVVAADHQTAGRGRLGRRWEAPPDSSLLVSVLLRPPPDAPVHLVTSTVGLAAAAACEEVAGVKALLKWPNDLVISDGTGDGTGDRKLGGILGEVVRQAGDVAVVVGLGLNVNWGETRPPPPGVALDEVAGVPVSRTALLVALLCHLDRLYRELGEPGGPSRLLDDYRARSATLGRRVRVELSAGAVEGLAVAITDEGHLVVQPEGSRRLVVAAGDVVRVRPA